jgi:formylglycine-generating enzyme required for sulfatase activity
MNKKTNVLLLTILIIVLYAIIAHARLLRVSRDNVDAFQEANVNSGVLETLKKNDLFEILDKDEDWYQIELPSKKKAWVRAEDVDVKGAGLAAPEAEETVLNIDGVYSNSFAVIIAVDDYREMGTLGYGKNDAAALRKELGALGFRNIIELYNDQATYESITNLFERTLLKRIKKEDRVFVFIATKSLSIEIASGIYEGYILPYDAMKDNLDDTAFSIDILDSFFAKLAAKHILVVYDSCLSGLSLKKAVSIPQSVPGYLLNVTSTKARQVITAGKHDNEMVMEGDTTLFINALIEGINGSAEQGVPDGIVTGSELGAYLKLKTSIKSERKQTPDFGRMQGPDKGGELIFTRRKGNIKVTKPIELQRELEPSPEEAFLEEITTPEESAKETILLGDDEDIEDEEVAGPLLLFPGELVVIPAGDFPMGSMNGHINERPVHIVYLDSYYIGRYEVTNKEYKEFIDATGYPPPVNVEGIVSDYNLWQGRDYPPLLANQPVVNVSWYDAVAYCKWLSSVTGEEYRLPTEAEWEKAARSSDERMYPWGNKRPTPQHANYKKEWSGRKTILDVGSFERGKSPYWVYEMSGNVWEWCSDWYADDTYMSSDRSNPQGPEKNWSSKVVRGGSWASRADMIRSTARYGYYPELKSSRGGFRIVLEPER